MFGMGLLGFDEDPFARSRHMFSQMDAMMNSMMGGMEDPFLDPYQRRGGMVGMPAIMAGPSRSRGSQALMRHDPFSNMMSAMENASRQGNCHSFSSSTVMSMTSGPNGAPQVYQATSSSKSLPGGLNETRRTVSDSRTGTKKMSIGRHVGDKGYVKEKEMNREGELEENDEYINMDEEEIDEFEREFRRRAGQGPSNAVGYTRHYPGGQQSSRQRNTYLALPSTSGRRRNRPLLAIGSGSSRHDDTRHRQKEKGSSKKSHR